MQLRALNELGIEQFRDYIGRIRAGSVEAPPLELLANRTSSNAIAAAYGAIDVQPVQFASKQEMVNYLAELLKPVPRQVWRHDTGLWAWLALLFFEQLAPAGAGGKRKLLADDLYIPSAHFRRRYRNLLLGPFLVFSLQQQKARLLLAKPVHVWSDVEEQLLGVQDIIQIPGALEAADLLYFDAVNGEPKRGITNRKKGGTIRRLREILLQFDLTFDIFLLTGPELIALLPPEFDRFKSAP